MSERLYDYIEIKNLKGIGELVVKGPSVMLGYYENKEATNEVLKNGWFYTGDLAKIDEEGYIYICGRKKSVIVLKNGKNIFIHKYSFIISNIKSILFSCRFNRYIIKSNH